MTENATMIRVSPQDAWIDRETSPTAAYLYDADGELVASFPADVPDEQIMRLLPALNRLYAAGYERGQAEKAAQVRAALGLPAQLPTFA